MVGRSGNVCRKKLTRFVQSNAVAIHFPLVWRALTNVYRRLAIGSAKTETDAMENTAVSGHATFLGVAALHVSEEMRSAGVPSEDTYQMLQR